MDITTKSYLLVCGLCCIYPILAGVIAVLGYRRYQAGGWRNVFNLRDQ